MGFFTGIVICALASSSLAKAQSSLLEDVKRNPNEAIALCKSFRKLNSKGISAGSKESLAEISRQRNISKTNAEVLSTYVRGLHCPDVK